MIFLSPDSLPVKNGEHAVMPYIAGVEKINMTILDQKAKIVSFEKKGDNFYGVTRERDALIKCILTPERPAKGAEFILFHQWGIYVNDASIDCVMETGYTYTNDNRKPTVDELYLLTKDAYRQATRLFNGQLEEQHIDIVPREVPEYPLAGRLENILASIIQKTFPEN